MGRDEKPLFWSKSYFDPDDEVISFCWQSNLNSWKTSALIDIELLDGDFLIVGSVKEPMKFVSPAKATFGGPWGPNSKNSINDKSIQIFLEEELPKLGVSKFEVTLPPSSIPSDNSRIFAELLLSEFGATKKYSDLNYSVEISKWTVNNLSKGNRKKLRQADEAGAKFHELRDSDWGQAYRIIQVNREEMGAAVSITSKQLLEAKSRNPAKYKAFGVSIGNELIAAAFTVETWPDTIYVYLWADDKRHRGLSPVVRLFKGIVDHSKAHGIAQIDLGTASLKGEINSGLSVFKSNLGAQGSEKVTLEIDLN